MWRLWKGGWQLKKKHRGWSASTAAPDVTVTAAGDRFWQPTAPFKLVFGGNPRTRRRRAAGAAGQPSAARASVIPVAGSGKHVQCDAQFVGGVAGGPADVGGDTEVEVAAVGDAGGEGFAGE